MFRKWYIDTGGNVGENQANQLAIKIALEAIRNGDAKFVFGGLSGSRAAESAAEFIKTLSEKLQDKNLQSNTPYIND